MVIQSANLIYPTKRAGVQACGRAGVRACRRAGVRKIEFKRGVLSVRTWSVKRAGVESSTYKPRLPYLPKLEYKLNVKYNSNA